MVVPRSKNIVGRHSTREFRQDALPKEALEAIIGAGTLAPSSKNRQPWLIAVIPKDKQDEAADKMQEHIIRRLDQCEDECLSEDLSSAMKTMDVLKQAPASVAICYVDRHPYRNAEEIYRSVTDRFLVDCLSIGACIENMLLEAEEQGVASLWIGDHLYAQEELKECLGIQHDIFAMVAFGYPAEPSFRPRDRASDRVMHLRFI